MLEGLLGSPIIAGAYQVGPAMCPGLAAYRRGARTGYSDFAKVWDRYARGRGIRRARDEDVSTLVTVLRASLAADGALSDGPLLPGEPVGPPAEQPAERVFA